MRWGRSAARTLTLVLLAFGAVPALAQAPAASGVTIESSAGDDQTYALGETIEADVTFDKVVHVDETASELELVLSIGEHSRGATFVEGSGTDKLRFRYTVQSGDYDNDGIAIGPALDCMDECDDGGGSLLGAVIRGSDGDLANREFDGIDKDLDHKVDGVPPAPTTAPPPVAITSTPAADSTYGVGEQIVVDINFDEAVHVDERVGALTLTLSVGANSRSAKYVSGSGTTKLMFLYTVQAGDSDADGISIGAGNLSLVGGSISDAAGNPAVRAFDAVPKQAAHKVDGVSPAVRKIGISSTPASGTTYGLNEKIRIALEFGEEVHVTDAESMTLIVAIGQHSRAAAYVDGSGTDTLTFEYTVQTGDLDEDGISVGPNALDGGTIEDGAGNPAVRSFFGLAAQAGHKVDGGGASATATIQSVVIASDAGADDTYAIGDVILVDVNFSDEVYVASGAPVLKLTVGTRSRDALYQRGSGTETLRFQYTVLAGDEDADGIDIAANALRGGVIENADGDLVNRSSDAVAADDDHKVDGVRPGISSVTIPSDPNDDGEPGDDDTYGVGDDIEVDVTFDENVHVDETGGELVLVLSIGEHSRLATFIGGSGATKLTFRYTVRAGDADGDGISIGPDALRGGSVQDSAGNPAERTFAGIAAQAGHKVESGIESTATTITEIDITSDAGTDDTYAAGEVIEFDVTFSTDVYVKGTVTVDVTIGEHTRQATFVRGSGTDTLTFRYVVQSNDYDGDGISLPPECLIGVVVDAAGDAVDDSYAGRPPDSGHKVDGRLPPATPEVVSMTIVSDGGPHAAGEAVEVEVVFSADVYVSRAPVLVLAVGRGSRNAAFQEGNGTNTLLFSYTVGSGDLDTDGVGIGPDPLRGGVIEDRSGRAAIRRFPGLAADPQHTVDGVSPEPMEMSITSTPGGGDTYGLGEAIEVEVEFDEIVSVDQTSQLALVLSVGQRSRTAAYDSGDGTTTLTFSYTVREGDIDANGIGIGPDALWGGVIEDAAGNPANRRLPALENGREHRVDSGVEAEGAAIRRVRITSDPGTHDRYKVGDDIGIEVTFDAEVGVSGAPVLDLWIGSETRVATFRGDDRPEKAPTLVFRYTVRAGDMADDGVAIGPNALRAGTIDVDGVQADRPFAGLAADRDHRVDGVAPGLVRFRIVSTPRAGGAYAVDEEIRIAVDFDENVRVKDRAGLAIDLYVGERRRAAGYVAGSGGSTLTFGYAVRANDADADGISIDSLQGGVIEDEAGNRLDRSAPLSGLDDVSGHRVDGRGSRQPRVGIVSRPNAGQTYGLGEDIEVEVDFDKVVHVVDAGGLALLVSIGDQSREARLATGSGTDALRFRYEVQPDDYDDDGISVGPNALRGGVLEDAGGNPVDRVFSGLPADVRHRVDGSGTPPTRIRIVSRPDSNFTYGLNDEIRFEFEFDGVVHVVDAAGLVLVVVVGEHSREATLVGGSGTNTLTFRYVVQSGDYDDDGISIGPNALRGGVIEDADGNPADRQSSGLAADANHRVDGIEPTLVSVRIASAPSAGSTYGLNEEIRFEVRFGEVVHVKSAESLGLDVVVGEHSRAAAFVEGSGTDTLHFSYTVQLDDLDSDGVSLGPDCLVGGEIVDAGGNPVDRTYPGLAADDRHRVSGVIASLTRVRIASTPDGSGTYGLNEAIVVLVEFGEAVHVTSAAGELSLGLSIGEHLRAATLVGGSGTDTLTFRYVVQPGDHDDDGISIGPNALGGGVIEDDAGNEVSRAFAGIEADRDHKVDGVRPSVTEVRIDSTPDSGGAYGPNEPIVVLVEFGEAVHVTSAAGELSLALAIGEHLRAATLVGGSGTDTLTFRYVVQPGDHDDDGISIGPNALRGGVIEDDAGNEVSRAFAGIDANSDHKVDARVVVVAIMKVAITSDAGSNGSYTTDDVIRIEVKFNAAAYVTGAPPVLELSIGPALREATFVEGSGTDTLKFEYTVEAGDTDTDGISIAANALRGGITGASGNPVDLTFEAVPASASHKVSAELLLFPLSLTLVVGESHSLDLLRELARLGVPYAGGFDLSSDDATVATAVLSGSMLTITSVSEGATTIVAAATDAAIFLHFGVTVETSAAETAVLEGALAAVGRGLLASAETTIGSRLEAAESNPPDVWGGLDMAPASLAAWPQGPALDAAHPWGSAVGHGTVGADDPYLQRAMGYAPAQLLRGTWFEMPFGGVGNSINAWAVWGAGDWHAFQGSPDDGLYDGSLASAYLGIDARGEGWVAGATVSRAMAEASYEFAGATGGKGRLETELNLIHPYVQWALGNRGKAWAILGFGTGEATAEREGQTFVAEPSDLSMHMGLGGLRYSFGRVAWFDLALRGDAGYAQLETEEGPRAIEGLTVNVQRLRLGAEASLPMALAGIPVSPFVDVAGRFDGGDGETGGGVELAGGFRYRGPAVGLEVKGRTLAMHSAGSYSEEGVKATLVVGPDGRKGFRLMLAPRWGGAAEAMDIFRVRSHPFAGALRRENRGWGLGTRVSYGFDTLRRRGTVMPFAELDLSGDAARRTRLGVSYEIASAVLGLPHRLEISGEGTESELHGTIMRFLLTGQAHF